MPTRTKRAPKPPRRSKPTPTEAAPVEVMDTTLRDGEQTPDVSYSPVEKRELARYLLFDVGVDRIEVASTRVSEGEREATKLIAAWARKARCIDRVEVLGYCDGKASVDWLVDTGARQMNLLTKGSELHCRTQLGLEPAEHRKRVAETVKYAHQKKVGVSVYLEDWSSGVKQSFAYVYAMVEALRELGIGRIYLPDTLGTMSPSEVTRFFGRMTELWPDQHFEFHGHNDYALATANCIAAVEVGARGVHTSVNGMGERAGNSKLAEVVAAIHDHTAHRTGVNESRLSPISTMVATFSGKELAPNAPIVGRDVFTQTAGIHADGDAKGDLYGTQLSPKRFKRERRYALGKLSGKASVDHNLDALGIELSAADRDLVLQRVIELGDRKKHVSQEDLPYIIADVLKSPGEQLVRVQDWSVQISAGGEPHASIALAYRGKVEKAEASGDGGYDAFMQALRKAAKALGLAVPRLADYRVRIPPGGRTEALVETLISWRFEDAGNRRRPGDGDETFSTLGVDSDQTAAAVLATEKMLNLVLSRGGAPGPGGTQRESRKKTAKAAARTAKARKASKRG